MKRFVWAWISGADYCICFRIRNILHHAGRVPRTRRRTESVFAASFQGCVPEIAISSPSTLHQKGIE